ncbi:MAG: hypothetical protein ABI950_00760 [Solirubrobacteraceae bacterium]
MRRTLRTAAVTAAAIGLVSAASAGAAGFTAGSSGLGDPLYPLAGNGGYDVGDYALTLG